MKIISVKVRPNARASALREGEDGVWLADVQAPPIDGKANAELIALVAAHFGSRKAVVAIARGASARVKRVAIDIAPGEPRGAASAPISRRR
ncbi:MAG TPA: DUF167 domain-containing protein [Casimicrobiaceae bacterium]|jgi:hypothetical protein